MCCFPRSRDYLFIRAKNRKSSALPRGSHLNYMLITCLVREEATRPKVLYLHEYIDINKVKIYLHECSRKKENIVKMEKRKIETTHKDQEDRENIKKIESIRQCAAVSAGLKEALQRPTPSPCLFLVEAVSITCETYGVSSCCVNKR